jgi:hypothetical protein
MKPDEPFAAENRRLSILAVRRGMEKVAAQGQDGVQDEEQPKARAKAAGVNRSNPKPDPTAN